MISLELSNDEALILFEWLSKFEDCRDKNMAVTAEVLIAWSLHAQLEKALKEPFEGSYLSLLTVARSRIEATLNS